MFSTLCRMLNTSYSFPSYILPQSYLKQLLSTINVTNVVFIKGEVFDLSKPGNITNKFDTNKWFSKIRLDVGFSDIVTFRCTCQLSDFGKTMNGFECFGCITHFKCILNRTKTYRQMKRFSSEFIFTFVVYLIVVLYITRIFGVAATSLYLKICYDNGMSVGIRNRCFIHTDGTNVCMT